MKKSSVNGKVKWLIISLLVVFFIGMLFLLQQRDSMQNPEDMSGVVLSKPIPLTSFQLASTNNELFTNKNLQGRWSLMFFGFTHCPMLCPTTLNKLNHAYQILLKGDARKMPQVLFVSIDPDRDSPQIIDHYLEKFNKSFIGLTGTKVQVDHLVKQLGIAYMKAEKSGESSYDIAHSDAILLINPQAQLVTVLQEVRDGKQIADVVRLVQSKQ